MIGLVGLVGCLSTTRKNVFKNSVIIRFSGCLSGLSAPTSDKGQKNRLKSGLSVLSVLSPLKGGGGRATSTPPPSPPGAADYSR